MSHLSQIKTAITNEAAICRACQVLELAQPARGEFAVYNTKAVGLGVNLRDWKYPVVINTDTGELSYDNFNGNWGQQDRLDEFCQRYALEVPRMAAEARGHRCEELPLENGARLLRIHMGDAAAPELCAVGGPTL